MFDRRKTDKIALDDKGLRDINTLEEITPAMVHKHIESEKDRYDNVLQALHNHIEEGKRHREELDQKLDLFIEQIKPVVQVYNSSMGLYESLVVIFKFLAVVAAGIAAIIFIKKL